MLTRVMTVLGVALAISVATSAESVTELIPLRWLDPQTMVVMLGGQPPPSPEEIHNYRQAWVNDFAARVARELPRDAARYTPRWYYASTITTAPAEQVYAQTLGGQLGGRGVFPLPEGLAGPPIAYMPQNALIVRGTPEAIDQLREIIALLDVKQRMVNVAARLLDTPTGQTNEWGIDFGVQSGSLFIASRGNAPPTGLQAMWRRGGEDVAVGVDQTARQGMVLSGANVTTTNNFPAVVTMGRMLPYFTSEVSYDQFGNRHVTTVVDAVFVGTELFVQPRINADDTITVYLRPTFIEAVGTVVGPTGTQLPITETLGAETQVTVRDGETLQIGGFERTLQEYNTRFRGLLKGSAEIVQSHPTLFLTATIVRDLEAGPQ